METLAPNPQTVLPPHDLGAMLDLSRFLRQVSQPAVLVGPDGQTVPLPMEAYRVLADVAEAMRNGKAITVAPVDQLLTTQEAADFLGISRPTLIKLLQRGTIPYECPAVGRHRRVRLQDVVDYQAANRTRRRQTLDDLTGQAVSDGLYEADAQDYAEALRAVRSQATT